MEGYSLRDVCEKKVYRFGGASDLPKRDMTDLGLNICAIAIRLGRLWQKCHGIAVSAHCY